MEQIMRSFLDTDLYKATMGQAIYHAYPQVFAGYTFYNRDKTPFPPGFEEELQNQINLMATISLSDEEAAFLKLRCGHYLRDTYIFNVLKHYRFDPSEVTVAQQGGNLSVTVAGLWYRTVFWEVPLLAIISELYYKLSGATPSEDYQERAFQKSANLHRFDAKHSEFGTRRRFSQQIHERIIPQLIAGGKDSFVGTSNLDLARRYDLTPIGTHAHEWFMAQAGMFGIRSANQLGLKVWADEFQGYLGFALTDTFTTEKFLQEFNAYYAKLFDGVRQDSMDPFKFTDMIVDHYTKVRVDPMTKEIVFSDALTDEKAVAIRNYTEGKIKQALFGIGTYFTNDVGVKPLNIVMKLSYIIRPQEPERRIHVIKFSDISKKVTGDPQAIRFAKYELGLA